MLQSHSLTCVENYIWGWKRTGLILLSSVKQNLVCSLHKIQVLADEFQLWESKLMSNSCVLCEDFMGQVYQRPWAALPQEAHSFSTPLPTHIPCLFWVRVEQFVWRWHFSLEHSLLQRCFYTTFYWEVRKYYRWKRRAEETKQIKEKNLPVGKISVSLKKILQVPMS